MSETVFKCVEGGSIISADLKAIDVVAKLILAFQNFGL